MKKILAILLVVVMVFAMAACGGGDQGGAGGNTEQGGAEGEAGGEAGGAYQLGLGIHVDLMASPATEDEDGNAQQDGVGAAVLLDSDGKIVKCLVDEAQNKMAFTSNGEVLEKDKSFQSKKERGDEYGMAKVSKLEKGEWYDQIAAFEAFVVGKTKDEVAAIAVDGEGYPTDEGLTAGCTMKVNGFIGAVTKACDNAVPADGAVDITLGLLSDMASSKDATEDEDGVAFSTTVYGSAAVDADGKVVACWVDEIQSKIKVGSDGTVVEVPETVQTKFEQGDAYNMAKVSPLEKGEWYEQIAAFDAFVVGKTKDEIAAIAVDGEGYPTDEALTAGCTMKVNGFIEALVKGM